MNTRNEFVAHTAYNMRRHALTMTTHAGSGHPTSALSAADIVATLFFSEMSYDLQHPDNPLNDRFILSKGHASPILYAVYRELGVLTDKDLEGYRTFDSPLEGHPTPRFKWTEAATGSLGQGLSVGVGMALNAKMTQQEYRTYVLLGDSEMAEGSVWEALELGAYYKLTNLVAIVDINRLGQRGETMEGWDLLDYHKKFAAFGWHPIECDGHAVDDLVAAFAQARTVTDKPVVVLAKTIKGYGVKEAENKNGFHGKTFSKEALPAILETMAQRFNDAANYSGKTYEHKSRPAESSAHTIKPLHAPHFRVGDRLPTRKAFGQALLSFGKENQAVVSLDAEVSNSTYSEYFAKEFPDRFVESFIAEQNMVGMAVGFAKLGRIPVCSTFGAFFSRAFDQIRMAAIGGASLRLVGSHAGVSIGEDGPSQMALEDIAMMRTIPNSIILYPSDAVSCWKLFGLMGEYDKGISYLRTTRGATDILYENNSTFAIGGCKVLAESDDDTAVVIGAGRTLHEVVKAYRVLKAEGVNIAVIDLYSIKPLDAETIRRVAKKAGGKIITAEDHYLAGGLGEAVVSALKNDGFTFKTLAVSKMPRSASSEKLLAYEEIDAEAIKKACLS